MNIAYVGDGEVGTALAAAFDGDRRVVTVPDGEGLGDVEAEVGVVVAEHELAPAAVDAVSGAASGAENGAGGPDRSTGAGDVPVVAVGPDDAGAAEAALDAGAAGYLPRTAAFERRLASHVAALLGDEPDGAGTALPPARQLRTVVENAPIVLFALDRDGTFTVSEGRGLERLGLAPGEVVGESVHDVYADVPAVRSMVERGLEGEHVADSVTLPSGAFDVWLRPVTDGAGEVEAVIGVAVDVTDRIVRERELEQFRTIVETVPDGVFVLDEEAIIVEANGTATEMFGFTREEAVGEPFTRFFEADLVEPGVADAYLDVVRRLLSSDDADEQLRLEFEITPPEGDRRIVEAHIALRPYEESFRGTIGVLRDITDRIGTERELRRQNERLERFASVVSHDLRNPLNVATGYLDLLTDDVEDERLGKLAASLDRMDRLVEDLLHLARFGQAVTDPRTVSLSTVAEGAWAAVSEPDASLEVRDDPVVEADADRLRQLLENLFRNAVEHGGADVAVVVEPIDDGFAVADDGPGIPPDERERVTEYGYSGDPDGTGLGLAIVAEIAEAHGWTVEVGEGDAGGARFAFHDSLETA